MLSISSTSAKSFTMNVPMEPRTRLCACSDLKKRVLRSRAQTGGPRLEDRIHIWRVRRRAPSPVIYPDSRVGVMQCIRSHLDRVGVRRILFSSCACQHVLGLRGRCDEHRQWPRQARRPRFRSPRVAAPYTRLLRAAVEGRRDVARTAAHASREPGYRRVVYLP